jgi:aspartyl aminopeptidase
MDKPKATRPNLPIDRSWDDRDLALFAAVVTDGRVTLAWPDRPIGRIPKPTTPRRAAPAANQTAPAAAASEQRSPLALRTYESIQGLLKGSVDGDVVHQECYLTDFTPPRFTGADGSLLSGFGLQDLLGVWAALQAIVKSPPPREGFVGLICGTTEGTSCRTTFCDDFLKRIGFTSELGSKSLIVSAVHTGLKLEKAKFLASEDGRVELGSGVVFASSGLIAAKLQDFAETNGIKTVRILPTTTKEREFALPVVRVGLPIGDPGAARELADADDVAAYFKFVRCLVGTFPSLP